VADWRYYGNEQTREELGLHLLEIEGLLDHFAISRL